ncbi:peptidase A4 family-domain-containing protein [Melanogaster broomeanus]|nr:peptidase A4 family-domain-containing protein [Melanogaster broomeanus]
MVSKLALVSNLLLASVTLAIPSSRLEARLARRREGRQSPPISRIAQPTSDVEYGPDQAGVVVEKANGTFTSVTGTFTIPASLSSNGAAASAWVGIDGYTCGTAILQTVSTSRSLVAGPRTMLGTSGTPAYAYDFSGVSLAAGDVIKLTVTASSTTSGTAVIENLSTSQTVTKALTSSYALCEADAEWIVEDFEEETLLVPFACGAFGTIEFTNASATGSSWHLHARCWHHHRHQIGRHHSSAACLH